ncbi:MAG TPA: hypothetical protein K8V51_02270 [Campylobacter avium]|uniref:hypothetical protein n=1 Tax=Campylobacter avium TaxID=522485 RepID=UPI001DA364F7|nr:hypothetical protein [Campylobacter avium]HJE65870.1 hypothetical protein [Campylobacter avium]
MRGSGASKLTQFAIFNKHIYYESAFALSAKSFKEASELFKSIEALKHKYYFVGYVAYEFYEAMENANFESKTKLVYFKAFSKRKRLKKHFYDTRSRYFQVFQA